MTLQCHFGHTFWVSFVLSTTSNSFHLCWTSGPVLVGQSTDVIFFFMYLDGYLYYPLVDNTFLHFGTTNSKMLHKLANRAVTDDLLVTDLFSFLTSGPLGLGQAISIQQILQHWTYHPIRSIATRSRFNATNQLQNKLTTIDHCQAVQLSPCVYLYLSVCQMSTISFTYLCF